MDEVINRWHQLYSGFALSQRYLSGVTLGKAELVTLNDEAEIWRERLMNVSWLKELDETLIVATKHKRIRMYQWICFLPWVSQ